jgi:anti-anti-sigma regulatory factor
MNFGFEKNGDIGVISFEGDLSSRHIDDIRSVLLLSMSSTNRIVLRLDDATNVDSSCMQMFCRTIRASKKLFKTIIMTGGRSRELSLMTDDNISDCRMECSSCPVECVRV